MGLFGTKASASRRFIDAIHKSSNKFANWDPPIEIKPGAWGRIDRKTGQFEMKGNVYTDKETHAIAAGFPLKVSKEEQELVVCSDDARKIDIGGGPQASVVGIAEAALAGRWEFTRSGGALLVMSHPKMTYIPDELLVALFRDDDMKKRFQYNSEYVLITQVHSCSAFFLCFSESRGATVDFALTALAPIPAAPGIAAGGAAKVTWNTTFTGGIRRDGSSDNNEHVFWPLYTARKLREVTRGPKGYEKEVDAWDEAAPPWFELDDNGEERATDYDYRYQTFDDEDDDN